MKVYQLESDFNFSWEWRVILKREEDQRLSVISALNNRKKIEIANHDQIEMLLINKEEKELRKEEPFLADMIYWTDDITLNAYNANQGVVISTKLKDILSKYKLPKHNIYPLKIINTETLDVNLDYHLLHIYGSISDITLFAESEYTLQNIIDLTIIQKNIGVYKDFQEFSIERKKNIRNKNIVTEITKRVIQTTYDVMPSYSNNIYVSEKLVAEKDKLTGVVFNELEDIVIKE